jgi:hypothetical protein
VDDEAQPIRSTVRRFLEERPAALGRHGTVLVAHGTRDPRHVVMSEQAPERSDDAAAASPCDTLAGCVAAVRNRRAVEDDEELTPIRCRR